MYLASRSGVFNWVLQAFGLAPAYVSALLYWANYIFSTSLYPVLFLAYLGNLNGFFGDDTVQFCAGLLLVVVVMFFNILGVEYLGKHILMLLFFV
jgi:amino acid transporter